MPPDSNSDTSSSPDGMKSSRFAKLHPAVRVAIWIAGAALAALTQGHPLLDAARSIAVVVCGGVTTPDTELRALHTRLSAAG